jgi:hypothetical protein
VRERGLEEEEGRGREGGGGGEDLGGMSKGNVEMWRDARAAAGRAPCPRAAAAPTSAGARR